MKLHITVVGIDRFHHSGISTEVADVYREAFRPLRTTDSPILAIALNEPMPCSERSRKVLTLRKDAAKVLGNHIAELLLKEMAKADTLNGYTLEEV